MTNDVHQIEIGIVQSLSIAFRDPITVIVYMAWLMLMSPTLTLFVLVLLPIAGFVIGRIARTLKPTALKGQSKLGMILSVMEETLSGLRVVKAFNAEDKMRKRFRSLNSLYTRIMNKLYRRQDLASPVSEFLGTTVVIFILVFGGSMVISGNATLPPEAFIGYLGIFLPDHSAFQKLFEGMV